MNIELPIDFMWSARGLMMSTCLERATKCRHVLQLRHIIEEVDHIHDGIRDLIVDTRKVFYQKGERVAQMDAIIEYLRATLIVLDDLHEDLSELLVESDSGRHSTLEVEKLLENARSKIKCGHNEVLRNYFKDLSAEIGPCRYKHITMPEHYDKRS